MPKNQRARERYWNTEVGVSNAPTAEPSPFGADATDSAPRPNSEQEIPEYVPTRRSRGIGRFFHNYLWETMEIVVVVIILGVLGWGAKTLYTLNREIGELHKQVQNNEEIEERVRAEIESLNHVVENMGKSFSEKARRLDERVDRIYLERE